MLALTYTGPLLFALSATDVWAKNQVCSASECIEGYSTSPLLASDPSSLTYLLPGTYSSTSYSPTSPLNASISTTSSSLIISTPDSPVGFTSHSYSGSGNVWTGNDWGMGSWKSIYLPNGWYAVLGQGKVLWGAIPEKNLLPMGVSWMGISYAGISACSPACSSHGTCIATNTSATCKCDEGWAGSICDSCSTGYYGTSCIVGPSNCTIWDDGYIGTGRCLGTATSASEVCGCDHGTCASSTECTCAAGWTTDSIVSSSLCNTCAQGFFQDVHHNCLACPLGCETCELQANTNSTAACTSCSSTLTLSTTNPTICVSSNGTCSSGSYYDSSTSSCESCSPACSTCTGPGTSECLSCASPRVNLQGSCVGYDSTTGKCDSSLSGLEGVFVVNNQKSECDSCPAGCLSCYIPSFSNAASYESFICQACQEGYLLEDGQCVKRCNDGWFLPEGSATTNGTCQQCDSSCSTCITTSTTCLSCSSFSMSAHSGSCIPSSSCPSSTVSLNGTCVTCPLDCATCSSASTCATCHSDRPILKDGRCVAFCSKDTYYDINTGTCQACDWSCKSCVGEGSTMCSSCSDGYMLKNGVCVDALCGDGGFANGFGMCLSSFVHKSQKGYLAFLVLIGVAMIVGIVFWLHVRRERRKTRQATKEFGERLDKRNVNDRLAALRLEKVFGFNRVTFGGGGDRSTQTTREDRDKRNKLRQFLFPSKRRSGDEEMEMKKSNFAPDKERHLYDGRRTSNLGRDGWIAPPPYIASQGIPTPIDVKHSFNRRDSLDSIPTPCRQTFALPSSTYSLTTAGPATPSCKQQNSYLGSTIIHSMSTTSPLPRLCSLMSPRRGTGRRESGNSFSGGSLSTPIAGLTHMTNVMAEKERDVRRYSGQHDGQMDVERRLIDLWPGLKERDREREGFI
ncbi:hypothetical protein I312_106238 [Cryptococcus bacillisporus CA1280]|uniref:uncharacterized protein n=1 Tax=Cryptococcus bacillisporus CA1280 TaxID=1296109 RepID=UPI003367CBD8